MNKLLLAGAAIFALSNTAYAVPVDLSGWSAETGPGAQAPGNWLLAPDNNSVTQTINSRVGVFSDGSGTSQGTALSGTITVNTTSDDDFIGFVLGFDNGELDGSAASFDYWLIDWKQGAQNYVGTTATPGLALSHVTGATTDEGDFWGHEGVVEEVARGTTLGASGWTDLTEYAFELIFTDSLIEVWVDNVLEISYAGSFTDGGFGFYGYSQGNVTYAQIQEEPVVPPIPVPAGFPLLLGAIGVLGIAGRRRKG